MSAATITLLALAGISYLLKAGGPLLLGGRTPPPLVARLGTLIPAPLLAALVLTSAIVDGNSFRVDERLFGLAAAAIALRLKANFVVVVIVAAAATALARTV